MDLFIDESVNQLKELKNELTGNLDQIDTINEIVLKAAVVGERVRFYT